MGLWDFTGELKKEGRNEAVEVPEREVKSSGIVGGEYSQLCRMSKRSRWKSLFMS